MLEKLKYKIIHANRHNTMRILCVIFSPKCTDIVFTYSPTTSVRMWHKVMYVGMYSHKQGQKLAHLLVFPNPPSLMQWRCCHRIGIPNTYVYVCGGGVIVYTREQILCLDLRPEVWKAAIVCANLPRKDKVWHKVHFL